jgi:hypothetical protein
MYLDDRLLERKHTCQKVHQDRRQLDKYYHQPNHQLGHEKPMQGIVGERDREIIQYCILDRRQQQYSRDCIKVSHFILELNHEGERICPIL